MWGVGCVVQSLGFKVRGSEPRLICPILPRDPWRRR
jgi:hypothetical protein